MKVSNFLTCEYRMTDIFSITCPFLFLSSGMFISAFEDTTGVLDLIEEKIARATMIPRSHGEVILLKHFQLLFYFLCHFM